MLWKDLLFFSHCPGPAPALNREGEKKNNNNHFKLLRSL